MYLTSPAFSHGSDIPSQYTCDGADAIPPLSISSPPKDTACFVLIMDDPDSPSGTWDHWIAYDIPADTRRIDGKAPGLQGMNSWSRPGYGGPCPGKGEHRYFFRLYAVSRLLGLRSNAHRAEVEHAMRGHVIAEARLMGRYIKKENR